jgi:phosphohistidine phosphatase SixA
MNMGKGWVIIEESVHTDTKFLVSIIGPRRPGRNVQQYMEQVYVDKYASIEEKIAYKKKPESWPYRAEAVTPLYIGVIHCGHDPIMMAYYCHKLKLKNGVLEYAFKTLQGQTDEHRPIFKEVVHSINAT